MTMTNQRMNNDYKVNKRKSLIAIHYFEQTAHVLVHLIKYVRWTSKRPW